MINKVTNFFDEYAFPQVKANYALNGIDYNNRFSARPISTGISYAPQPTVQHFQMVSEPEGTVVTGYRRGRPPISEASRAYLQQYIDTVSDPNYGVTTKPVSNTPSNGYEDFLAYQRLRNGYR